MRSKRLAIVILGTISIVLLVGVMPIMAKTISWRMQSLYPATDLSTSLQGQTIVDTLNKRLEGKLQIKFYMPGQIVPEEEMFDALSKGVYDAALYSTTWSVGQLPEGIVAFGLPMGWKNVNQVFEFFYDYGFLKWMRKLHVEHNIFYACPLPCSPLPIMSNFPFRKLEDIKGKKLWSIGPTASYVQHLGATSTIFPPAEMYMALKLGTIDGFIYSTAELETSGYKEVIKYINWPAVIDPLCVEWIINLKSWNALPPDIQKTIEDTLVEIGQPMFEKYMADNRKGLEAAERAGVKTIHMEPGEVEKLRGIAAEVWEETAAKSESSRQTVQMLKDYLATKGIPIK
jgi:TRAP-type mannitol/chloroaromatic compound transport system substrate-binding protein